MRFLFREYCRMHKLARDRGNYNTNSEYNTMRVSPPFLLLMKVIVSFIMGAKSMESEVEQWREHFQFAQKFKHSFCQNNIFSYFNLTCFHSIFLLLVNMKRSPLLFTKYLHHFKWSESLNPLKVCVKVCSFSISSRSNTNCSSSSTLSHTQKPKPIKVASPKDQLSAKCRCCSTS